METFRNLYEEKIKINIDDIINLLIGKYKKKKVNKKLLEQIIAEYEEQVEKHMKENKDQTYVHLQISFTGRKDIPEILRPITHPSNINAKRNDDLKVSLETTKHIYNHNPNILIKQQASKETSKQYNQNVKTNTNLRIK